MLKVRFVFVVLAVVMIAGFSIQRVQAVELRYDSDTADDYTFQLTDGYLVRFTAPDFVEPFITDISFYGYRFGTYDSAKSPTGYVAILDANYNKIVSRDFAFSTISTKPAWNHFSFEPFIAKGTFWVYILIPSNLNSGIMMGKDLDPASLRSRIGNHATGFKPISDGRYNWMVRCFTSDGPPVNDVYTSDTLKGNQFVYKDNGINSGTLAIYRYGATLRLEAPSPITIDKVYAYGKLAGNWYNTEREFTIYLLDADLRIILSRSYPYRVFSSQASWRAIDIPNTKVSGKYYVAIEPNCRDEVQLELGHDSAPNKASMFASNGISREWPYKLVDLSNINWMIRLKTV